MTTRCGAPAPPQRLHVVQIGVADRPRPDAVGHPVPHRPLQLDVPGHGRLVADVDVGDVVDDHRGREVVDQDRVGQRVRLPGLHQDPAAAEELAQAVVPRAAPGHVADRLLLGVRQALLEDGLEVVTVRGRPRPGWPPRRASGSSRRQGDCSAVSNSSSSRKGLRRQAARSRCAAGSPPTTRPYRRSVGLLVIQGRDVPEVLAIDPPVLRGQVGLLQEAPLRRAHGQQDLLVRVAELVDPAQERGRGLVRT